MDETSNSTEVRASTRGWTFTISDLFIASLFSAILFAMNKVKIASDLAPNAFSLALFVPQSLVHGFCLAAIARIIRTENSPGWASRLRHPGHWILIQSLLWMAFVFATFFPHLLFPEWRSYEAFQVARYANATSGITFLIVCTVAAWRMETRWRVFFMILATHALLDVAEQFSSSRTSLVYDPRLMQAARLTNLLATGWLIYVLVVDYRKKIARDWMHWAGVGGWLFLFAVEFAILQLTSMYYSVIWQP